MPEVKKAYFIETDLIEISGKDPIKIIGERGNLIYIDFEKIERLADDTTNPKHMQFQEALEYIYQGKIDIKKKQIELKSGGILSWAYDDLPSEEKRKIHHVTRKKGTLSRLKRKGITCEFPRFLRYMTDIFDSGIIDLQYQGSYFNLTLADLEKYYPDEDFTNNQVVRFNGTEGTFFRVNKPLRRIGDSRWVLDDEGGKVTRITFNKGKSSCFAPRNPQQAVGFEFLMDRNVECMVIVGGSGSGKTIMAYAAAIEQILDYEQRDGHRKSYDGIVLFKSSDMIGGSYRDEGFLPGTAYEKAKPYLQSFIDAHRLLGLDNVNLGGVTFENLLADPFNDSDEFGKRTQNKLFKKFLPPKRRAIEIAHLRYARGRTFENQIVFVDEAQNYSPFEIKQLIERVGEGSKIILVGDPEQIDNPSLDKEFNGLVYATHIFYNVHPRMALIKLDKNYRSQSAEIIRNRKAPKI
jgi:predicted ribonuclease YlaK